MSSSEDEPDEVPQIDSEGEGEELIDENMARDYRIIPQLDHYESEDIDIRDYDEMDPAQRAAAERFMQRRDDAKRRGRRRGPAMLDESDSDDEDRSKRRGRRFRAGEGQLQDDETDQNRVNLENYSGPLVDWLRMDGPRLEVKRRFRRFLVGFRDEHTQENTYTARIQTMCRENRQSLEVSYLHFSQDCPLLAIWLADEPSIMLEIFNEEAKDVVMQLYENYDRIHPDIFVRITELPVKDTLRELRTIHLNGLIRVSGVVTRRTQVFPQLKVIKFICLKCSGPVGPYLQNSKSEVFPGSCPDCQSRGPFQIDSSQTAYRNYQRLTLQESPGSVPAGRVPRSKEVIVQYDLIDCARPGEEIEVTGIYTNGFDASLNSQNGFPVFATVIEANHVAKSEQLFADYNLTDEDRREIRDWSKRGNVSQVLFDSIAPSIFGLDEVRRAIALSMFGGEPKRREDTSHRIRGDINVLLLGDPGTAKSQFLKYVELTASRAVFTTGKGASAVGLTAAVRKDPVTREWTLEGGALVLADRGICLIDEFDKMNDQDRTSIHEAMEQQSISVSKAGIVTSLQARCAVIAAANPIGGRYDASATFAENVELTDPILSRFDCLCVVRDTVDPTVDTNLANFVVNSHMRSHPDFNPHNSADLAQLGKEQRDTSRETMSQELLKKYIMYARLNCHPKLDRMDQDKLQAFYAQLRTESMVGGGVPVGPRHLESIIRMSEAHAKMHLRDYVNDNDLDIAIQVMLESFISAQKFSVMRALRSHFKRYLNLNRGHEELLFHVLKTLVREVSNYQQLRGIPAVDDRDELMEVEKSEFEAKAAEMNIPDASVHAFYRSDLFKSHGYSLDSKESSIRFVPPQ